MEVRPMTSMPGFEATQIDEIAPDFFRLSTFSSEFNLQFCQFLVRDKEPLLFHTGMRAIFPQIREAVSQILNPETIRWISFSHYEADECGALNEWLSVAPRAQAACSLIAASVNVNDLAIRPARALEDKETIETGKYRFRFYATQQVPHGWDAGLLFEETQKILFCSDLFHQLGNVEPITKENITERFRKTLDAYNAGPFAHYLPYTEHTNATLMRLAALNPKILLPMHGSAYIGDGNKMIQEMAQMLAKRQEKLKEASLS